jgi:hypothetical protein
VAEVEAEPLPFPSETASTLPAAIALGITVADVYASVMRRLGPAADARLALELTKVALGSQLVGTLLTRKEATMIAVTPAIAGRCGRNKRPIRPSETPRAWAFSAAVTYSSHSFATVIAPSSALR